jgi:predicted Co/Zn/Cd cation transporter (cation efflux family)
MYTTFIVPPIEQVRETLEELSLIQPNTVTEEVELEMEEEVIQEQIQENNEREFLI